MAYFAVIMGRLCKTSHYLPRLIQEQPNSPQSLGIDLSTRTVWMVSASLLVSRGGSLLPFGAGALAPLNARVHHALCPLCHVRATLAKRTTEAADETAWVDRSVSPCASGLGAGPEVPENTGRWKCMAASKLNILALADSSSQPAEAWTPLWRQGLYSPLLPLPSVVEVARTRRDSDPTPPASWRLGGDEPRGTVASSLVWLRRERAWRKLSGRRPAQARSGRWLSRSLTCEARARERRRHRAIPAVAGSHQGREPLRDTKIILSKKAGAREACPPPRPTSVDVLPSWQTSAPEPARSTRPLRWPRRSLRCCITHVPSAARRARSEPCCWAGCYKTRRNRTGAGGNGLQAVAAVRSQTRRYSFQLQESITFRWQCLRIEATPMLWRQKIDSSVMSLASPRFSGGAL